MCNAAQKNKDQTHKLISWWGGMKKAGITPRPDPSKSSAAMHVLQDLEEKLAAYLDEQFETLVEDGSIEEVSVRACV